MYNKMWRNIMTMSFMMKYLLANCQRTGSCSRTSKWDFMERKDGFIVYFHRVSFLTNKMLFLLLWLLFTYELLTNDFAQTMQRNARINDTGKSFLLRVVFTGSIRFLKKHALDVITMRTVTIFFFTISAI